MAAFYLIQFASPDMSLLLIQLWDFGNGIFKIHERHFQFPPKKESKDSHSLCLLY